MFVSSIPLFIIIVSCSNFVKVCFCLVGFYEAPFMYNKEQEISNEVKLDKINVS